MVAGRLKALLHPAFLLRSLPMVAALAISCFITFEFNAAAREAHSMVEHSMSALAAMDQVLSLLQDAETGQRGYIVTGDDAYLAPYRAALHGIEPGLQRLDLLIMKNTAQHDSVERLRAISARKLAEMKDVIDVRRQQGLQAAANQVALNVGKTEMDELRGEIGEMKARETTILRDKENLVEARNDRIVIISIVALLISLAGRLASSLIRVPSQFRRNGS
ncbi:MAG: CHASE3 domain-containing protein [Mesorhizobium sp.]|uniref:CHASE3 domain-containing protein n=1 Tax=Mesorhizobium sp. TaxID=1871066 RepID=UPI001ACA41F8|nr:CHASE3 domain-containing protein [Mesorhizobium sp.]MBN9219326.1 CHASE3 domain-containing protein [Mesorhizobium sp.]